MTATPTPTPLHSHSHPASTSTTSASNTGTNTKNKSQEETDHPLADLNAIASSDRPPPTKRARKAINCAPCRASKLKCDKARPCSSCVLRGTAPQCYADGKDESNSHRRNGIDPHNEIARIRQSVATLEAYVIRGAITNGRSSISSNSTCGGESLKPSRCGGAGNGTDAGTGTSSTSGSGVKQEDVDADVPGMLAEKGKGGFYAGPTSTATLLYSLKNDAREGPAGSNGVTIQSDDADLVNDYDAAADAGPTDISRGFDDDLLAQLPAIHVIDGLVDYYLHFCNWMYRHVHPSSFSGAWTRFKECASADRVMLATLAVVMAVAVRYLPEQHALLGALPGGNREDIGERFYMVACEALGRYRAESRALSLELVELLLIRTHYLTLSKDESEEIWAIRGELVSIGTAMGLHRDPDKWRMTREVAERRRWAWWHIVLLERWQCFLFGRPLSVAAHHFDTRLPSHVDESGRPNICMFKLADILGDIVDDAVSIRPVPYSRVLERDKDLVAWMDDLPKELDLDEYRLARSLASPDPADMRLGVLSVIIRTSYYHIRFTLHRPYAAAAHDQPVASSSSSSSSSASAAQNGGTTAAAVEHHSRMAKSLDTAASAADKLIQLVAQARPEVLGSSSSSTGSPSANASLAVSAHVHWGPFHCFSAAMFFSLQLVADPHQPGASLFRANIRRVLELLAMSRGVPIADKASDMLRALRPLYDGEGRGEREGGEEEDGRGRSKESIISLVKSLAFPYHDSLASHGHGHHGGNRALSLHTGESPHSASASPSVMRSGSINGGMNVAPVISPSSSSSISHHPHSYPNAHAHAHVRVDQHGHSGLTPAPPYSRGSGTASGQAQLADILAPPTSSPTSASTGEYPAYAQQQQQHHQHQHHHQQQQQQHQANGNGNGGGGPTLRPTPTFPLPTPGGGAFPLHSSSHSHSSSHPHHRHPHHHHPHFVSPQYPQQQQQHQHRQQQQHHNGGVATAATAVGGGISGSDTVSMVWGASVGFGQGEWNRFLDVLERSSTEGGSTAAGSAAGGGGELMSA